MKRINSSILVGAVGLSQYYASLVQFGKFSKLRIQGILRIQGDEDLYSMGGWKIFRVQGDGLCRTMTFSRGAGVQTPEETMMDVGSTKCIHDSQIILIIAFGTKVSNMQYIIDE